MVKRNTSLMRKPKTEQSETPPDAKPLPSRWIPDNDPTPRVNVDYRKVPRQFMARDKFKSF